MLIAVDLDWQKNEYQPIIFASCQYLYKGIYIKNRNRE